MFSSRAFDPKKDIPDLSGKVILLTGGNAGLGKETLIQLAQHNPAHIWLAARTQAKADQAIEDIKKAAPETPISFLKLDLASLQSISEAAQEFRSKSDRLDILINNAGIMCVPNGKTADGIEIQFGTNHMGPFLLTKLLMPTLQATAKAPGADVRIVNLSSDAHRMAPFGMTLDERKMQKLGPSSAYCNSKLANVHFAQGLAKRYPEITSVAVHPGVIAGTQLWDPLASGGFIGSVTTRVCKMFFPDVEQGARNQTWASTCKKEELQNGAYYTPIAKLGKSATWGGKAADQLWEWSEAKCKEKGY